MTYSFSTVHRLNSAIAAVVEDTEDRIKELGKLLQNESINTVAFNYFEILQDDLLRDLAALKKIHFT